MCLRMKIKKYTVDCYKRLLKYPINLIVLLLWRVENGKIAEHWDVMETIADKSTWQNQNGKF